MTLPAVEPLDFPPPYPPGNPRFAPGETVHVKSGSAPGHVRTPWYLRGKTGVVERVCGAFANPEELAYNRDGMPERVLYRVRFSMDEVWGNGGADTIDAEIFEHWLEAV
ncbi:MAG: SH3-like domain-containing protein [Pseudomonadota bacterium]